MMTGAGAGELRGTAIDNGSEVGMIESMSSELINQRVKIVDEEKERNGQTGIIVLVFEDEFTLDDGQVTTMIAFLLVMDKDSMFYEVYAEDCQLHSTRVY